MRQVKPLILTLDAGTSGIKCAAFDPDAVQVKSVTKEYRTYYPRPGWAQQKPADILDAAVRAIRETLEQVPVQAVAALVFTGTMNGCIPLGADGEPLYDNIIHSDTRCGKQTDRIAALIPQKTFYRITGNRIDVHSGLPKYLWLKENKPAVYRAAKVFVNIKDYLYGRACGRMGCTDRSDASLCACLDMKTGDWARDLLRTVGADAEKMPRLLDSADVSGRVTPAFAAASGLPAGLPVVVGGGDGACAAHGARQHRPGSAYMNIGSSAWVSAMSPVPVWDAQARIFQYFDLDASVYNVCGTVQCAASALDWAAGNLAEPGKGRDYAALEALARQAPPGAEGVFFLPTLMGERTPWWTSRAFGTLTGLTLYHERKHVIRAVYEGVMQALAVCGDILRENGLDFPSLTLIGGGAESRLWAQLAASMLNVPVRVHEAPRQASSLGAAFAAGVGIGLYRSYQDAAERLRCAARCDPEPALSEAYEKHAKVYRSLYPVLRPAYEAIAGYQEEGAGGPAPGRA